MLADRTITVKTAIAGVVNDQPIKGQVVATLDTGRGGKSSCRFTRLPAGFTPATLGTHT